MKKNSSLASFKDIQKQNCQANLAAELQRLLMLCPQAQREGMENEFQRFQMLFDRYLKESGEKIDWEKINPPPADRIKAYAELPTMSKDAIKAALDKLVVLKLNGGLGTTMGCTGPKSVIEVREEMTFLDLTVRQIEHLNTTYGANVPILLMNSFNTDEDTDKVIQKYRSHNVNIITFNQSKFPRISKETLTPLASSLNNKADWYPPGHGDIYDALYQSGYLKSLMGQGKEYIFISNIDNLGATVDLQILNYLCNIDRGCEYVMEVTDKTRADVKGGTLINYENKLRLLEIAQVPKDHVEEFKSITKFRIFNTNNLWMKLSAIHNLVEEQVMNLEVIVNNKNIDGVNLIQLETAVGAGIKHFEGAIGINVPRSRFLPVKGTSDLFMVSSNLYSLKHGALVMNPTRLFPTVPLIKLGDEHFKKVGNFLPRFGSMPNIVELDHLTVTGDVTFGKGVTLKGTVIIVANHGSRIDIPAGAVLENKIVSGNLRILDH
eukprot:Nk52_evm19s310 gene=Nk52_evmTU19s310